MNPHFSSNYFFFFFEQSVREKPYPDEERVKGDPARDLATIHHLCEGSISELQNMAKSQVRDLSIENLGNFNSAWPLMS